MPDDQDKLCSFEKLFERNYQRFCQRVFRITNDIGVAEDIVQEVFISFWERWQRQSIETPEAYLYTACINKAINYTSSHKRKAQLQEAHYKGQATQTGSSPEQDMEQQELEERVQQSIDALPPMCRKVFLLSRYEEKSHKEIAAFLEISPNTVDNHIKKALSILRRVLLYLIIFPFKIIFDFFS